MGVSHKADQHTCACACASACCRNLRTNADGVPSVCPAVAALARGRAVGVLKKLLRDQRRRRYRRRRLRYFRWRCADGRCCGGSRRYGRRVPRRFCARKIVRRRRRFAAGRSIEARARATREPPAMARRFVFGAAKRAEPEFDVGAPRARLRCTLARERRSNKPPRYAGGCSVTRRLI